MPGVEPANIHQHLRLEERDNTDAVRTTDGELRFEYSSMHVDVIVTLAQQHGIRAWDAAAYITHQIFPELTILDSTKTPVSTLDALPAHTGVDQRSFHGESNFPLHTTPPAWFPKSGMPNVVFSWSRLPLGTRAPRPGSSVGLHQTEPPTNASRCDGSNRRTKTVEYI